VSTDVTVERDIARPREEVASYASDWRNDPSWITALTDVRLVTDGPFGVGSQVARVAAFLGKRIEYVNEVVEWERGVRLAMRSVKAPFPMTVAYEFEDAAGGGTLMRIRAGGDATGFYRVAGPLLNLQVRRGISRDLDRLKELLEASRG
jgi:uncharacterized membrane protein